MPEAARSLRLTAEIGALSQATEFAEAGAREAGLPADSWGHVHLVVEEIFMNIARYAYPEGHSGVVEISYSVPQSGLLCVELSDQGAEYDPLAAAEPRLSSKLRERSVGGLGVFLVRQLTRSLAYRREGEWNRLQFEFAATPGHGSSD